MSAYVKSIMPFYAEKEAFAEAVDGGPLSFLIQDTPIMDDDIDALREFVEQDVIVDPSPMSESSTGFASIDNKLNLKTDGRTVSVVVERRERLVPKEVVDRMTNIRVKDIEEREDRKLRRVEISTIKENVKQELMPKALIRSRQFPVTFFSQEGKVFMMIMNASDKLLDRVHTFITGNIAIGMSKAFKPVTADIEFMLNKYLLEILRLSIEVPKGDVEDKISEHVNPAFDIKLKHHENGNVTIKAYCDDAFETALLQYAHNDYFVSVIGVDSTLTGEDSIGFKLSDKGRFYGFSASNDRLDSQYGYEDRGFAMFASEAFVFSQEIIAQINLIKKVCGNAESIQ